MADRSDANLLVITGMSGAGKSRVIMELQDLGWFCIDNLPPALLTKVVEGMRLSNEEMPRTAIVADIRAGRAALPQISRALDCWKRDGLAYRLVFIDASDEVILRRYKENRRPHPLSPDGKRSLTKCIAEERELLESLRGEADIVIDTSETAARQLKEKLGELFLNSPDDDEISISLTSFGFKYGLPSDADMVIDVRFLPNPYYVPELKALCGLDQEVADYVLGSEVTWSFMDKYMDLLAFLLPNYRLEGKRHFTVAVGCTGGRHRSVAMTEELARRIRELGYTVTASHRDIDRKRG
ncbi:MAG: RNase adapter RapZ [Firmicutes bacterium]|nr:RNase adapter RapZ [Bacillota bacterium]MBR0179519.1 RNase adapter RapZ [Bacillota bacterium]